MKPAVNKSVSKSRALRKSLSKAQEPRRFRQMMFEPLEGRALLAGIEVPSASWQGASFVQNEMMVRFNNNITKDQATNELFTRMGATIKQWWPELNLAEVKFPQIMPNADAQISLITNVHNWTSVYYAEPNFIHQPELTPNDPGFPAQWGLNNIGQPVNLPAGLPPGTPGDDIDALRAWDMTTGDPNTVIAIVDTGVDYNHPDLAANIWRNPGEIADGIDNDGNGYIDDLRGWDFADLDLDPDDTDGHGTHVAGIAAAVGDNGIGVSGVSWHSKIMPIRAGNPSFTTAAIAGAQLYIAKMKSLYGINIVASNNSYGALNPFSFTEYSTIQTSINAGVVFVTSAGNATNNNDAIAHYPSSYNLNGIVVVASTDNNDQLSTFSNYGQTSVDLAAPGEQIVSTVPPFYNPPFNYDYFDGTSMASPHVAGPVALLKSFDPSLTVDQVKSLLMQGTDVIPSLATKVNSSGRLNIAKSLDLIPRNEIQGTVFEDLNGNKARDAGENGLPGWTVYMDRNNNGILDAGEPSTVTLADGSYRIRGVFGAGTYTIREVVQPKYTQTIPTANAGISVTLATKTSVVSNVTFGVKQNPGEIHGRKWNDVNGDGVMDPTEPGIPGIFIYVDVNNDVKPALGEPAAMTDQYGYYTILNVPPGTYSVREEYKPGYLQTFPDPASTDLGANTGVVVIKGTVTPDINFGNKAAFDYGDAPAPYPTLSSKNGAVHGILQGFNLGLTVDAEANGIPSVGATGDDASGVNDEDGVALSPLTPGNPAAAKVGVLAASGNITYGYLQGFIDFNGDGDWTDAGEQVFKDVKLSTGIYNNNVVDTPALTFNVPANAKLGATYARFRFSVNPGIGSTGTAIGGEVEDYLVNILGQNPTALPDAVTVNSRSFQSTVFDPIFVLANDLPSSSGPAGIDPTYLDLSNTQGLVVLNQNNTPGDPTDDYFDYQPAVNFVGIDTFQYRAVDPNGNVSAPATVTITVQFVPTNPIAVDNTYDVLKRNTAADPPATFNVLANDVMGTGTNLHVASNTNPAHGTVTVASDGTATYTADVGFEGSDSFTYTIIDSRNIPSVGTVTVQVLSAPRTPFQGATPAIIKFELQVVNKQTGLPYLDGALIPLGTSILVRGVVTDLRGSVVYPPPPDPTSKDFVGAFAAYMDTLFDKDKVQPFGQITFGGQFQDPKSGAGGTPGLIDEVGAAYSGTENSSGPSPVLVFTKEFLTTGAGPLQFVADPADISPDHDILAFIVNGTDPNQFLQPVPSTQVYYEPSFPNIAILGSGEGEDTNLSIPVDVNLDGKISPIDALLIVNYLNESHGSGEGEGSAVVYKRDVNHDNSITPIDALMVINALNRVKPVAPAGEGEAEDSVHLSPLALSAVGSSTGNSASSASDNASAPTSYASSVDQIFAQTDWSKPSVSRTEDAPSSKSAFETEDFLTGIGTSVRRNRKG